MTIYIALLALCVLTAVGELTGAKARTPILILAVAVLATIAGFRGGDVDRDHVLYTGAAEHIESAILNFQGFREFMSQSSLEPTFLLIVAITVLLGLSINYLFVFYAVISLSAKIRAFYALTPLPAVALAIHVSRFYLLHEMTQIRASVAIAFVLLALWQWTEGRRRAATFLWVIALSFHTSALLALILPFLSGNRPVSRLWLFAPWAALAAALAGVTADLVLVEVATRVGLGKIAIYIQQLQPDVSSDINVLSPIFLVATLTSSLLILMQRAILFPGSSAVSAILRVYAVAPCIFYLFSGFPVLAYRAAELLLAVQPIALSYFCAIPRVRSAALASTIVLCFAQMLYSLYVLELIAPYDTFLGNN
ncbi:EpsG family protein [Hydrocarboniphaga sp.]|uniref:EpsG family protein n=1 Tax=Hydrocarboniphaga sp. TaxID=2033016 RepID=UPI002AB7FC97|nr:EpsG family protein [Hydrocarboniphaga sp.]MDZ4077997.1 EpsG family protein [Hydrocarboniphaga sp.]